MAILKSGKLDSMNLNTQKPHLISSLSRGGGVDSYIASFQIFLKTDECFNQSTSKAGCTEN